MARAKSGNEHRYQSPVAVVDSRLPKAGTKLRAAYDVLAANKGVRIPTNTIPARIRRDLEDYYGCVIEYRGYRNCYMIFVGEMMGDEFIDFRCQ